VIAAMADELRHMPDSISKRAFYIELLCFNGEFAKAEQQLETLLTMSPDTLLTVATWRQLVQAAQARKDVFTQGRTPEVIGKPTARIRTQLEILLLLREQRTNQAAALARALEQQREPCPAIVNGVQVGDVRDLDDLCGGILEVMASNGKYFWIEFEQIASLELTPPKRTLDLLWRKASLQLKNGSEGEVFIPAIYEHTPADNETARLGRKTDWQDLGGLICGIGQRMWLIGDQARPISEIRSLSSNHSLQLAAE